MTTVFSMQEELKNKEFWSSNVAFGNGPKGKRKKKNFYTDIYSHITCNKGKKPTGNSLNIQQWDNS